MMHETVWRRVTSLATGLFSATIGAGYIALILAELGVFRLIPCMLLASGIGILAAKMVFARYTPKTRAEKVGWGVAVLIGLGSLGLTVPPSEMILGGWDPGVYIHTAAAISSQGSLQIPADDIVRLPPKARQYLPRGESWRTPFPGMFLLPNGRLSPQFMHLYPSLLAVGFSLAGVWGALLINPILNVIATLVMYWFASKVVGRGWGVAAALLLAVNPAQVWQAKFSTAELLTQVLLMTSFGAFLDFTRRRDAILPAAMSGVLFGLAFLTRYDVILVLVPLVLMLIALRNEPEHRRSVLTFLLVLTLFGIHAWCHMTFVAPCYRPLPHLVFPLLLLALSLGVVFLASMQFASGRRLVSHLTNRPTLLRLCLSSVFLCFLIFAWYVRPHLTVDGRVLRIVQAFLGVIGRPQWIGNLAGENALNIRYLVSIFGAFGLLLGCAGIVALACRPSDRGTAVWLVASLVAMVILVTNVFNDHFMMWVSRRFIPVVVPILVIGVAAAAKETYRCVLACCRPFAIPLSVGMLAAMTVLTMPKTVAMASTRDWPGMCSWYENLARVIPSDAIVLCDQPGFAAPLRFLYSIDSYEVYGGRSCSEFVCDNRLYLSGLRKKVCILTMHDQAVAAETALRGLDRATLVSHIQEQPKYSIPERLRGRGGHFVLYAVEFSVGVVEEHGVGP